jgi:hypothetical protein
MDTGGGDKSNTDHDLYLPQTDSFWEVCILNSTMKDRFVLFYFVFDR